MAASGVTGTDGGFRRLTDALGVPLVPKASLPHGLWGHLSPVEYGRQIVGPRPPVNRSPGVRSTRRLVTRSWQSRATVAVNWLDMRSMEDLRG